MSGGCLDFHLLLSVQGNQNFRKGGCYTLAYNVQYIFHFAFLFVFYSYLSLLHLCFLMPHHHHFLYHSHHYHHHHHHHLHISYHLFIFHHASSLITSFLHYMAFKFLLFFFASSRVRMSQNGPPSFARYYIKVEQRRVEWKEW